MTLATRNDRKWAGAARRHSALRILLAASVSAVLWALPATADRHCAPASEDYYNARNELLEAEANKEKFPPSSRAYLESARRQSAICGCAELETTLGGLMVIAGDGSLSVSDRIDQILKARQTVDRSLLNCHR